MPLRIFRSRSVVGANLFIALFMAAMFPTWYFQSLYMQGVLHFSPLKAGLAFLPMTVMIAVGAQVSSRLVNRVGARALLVVGPLLSALGLIWLRGVTPEGSFFFGLMLPSLIATFGMGLSFPASTLAATSGIAPAEAGLASGLLNTTRQVGGSIGLAALATLAADRTASLLAVAPVAPAQNQLAAFTAGCTRAFGVAGAICVDAAPAAGTILASPPRRGRMAVLELERPTGEPGLETPGLEVKEA